MPGGESAQHIVSRQNLIKLGLAMHGYHDVNGAFPTHAIYSQDGKSALLSWRVAILPYIEQEKLYREFNLNESWDSAHNKKLIANMPKIYAGLKPNDKNDGKTYYQVFTGPKTAFDGNKKAARLDSVGAEFSNTAFMTEAKDPVTWTKPADLTVPPERDKMPQIGSLSALLFGNGAVRSIPRETTPAALRAMVIPKE